jgi:hypothetical protein
MANLFQASGSTNMVLIALSVLGVIGIIIWLFTRRKDANSVVSSISFEDPYPKAVKAAKIQCPKEIKGCKIWLKGTNTHLGIIDGKLVGPDPLHRKGTADYFFYVPKDQEWIYRLTGGVFGDVTNVWCNSSEHSPLYGDVFLYGIGIDVTTGLSFNPLITEEYNLIKASDWFNQDTINNRINQIVGKVSSLVEKSLELDATLQKKIDILSAGGGNQGNTILPQQQVK